MSSIHAATKAVAFAEDAASDARNFKIFVAGTVNPAPAIAQLEIAVMQVRFIASAGIQPQESP